MGKGNVMKIIFTHTLNYSTLTDLRGQFAGAQIYMGQAICSEHTALGLIWTLTCRKIAFEIAA